MSDERWYFPKDQLENTPSRKYGIDADKELFQRQQAANFIRDMGQRLQVTQLCINTAIVYMHRFYVFHSFTHFHRNAIATAALFLAAKVEEQPRKLEHIIKVSQLCLQKNQTSTDRKSEVYMEQAQEVVMNENILLQTLGFDVAIEHPHSFIIKFCHLANVSKDLSQTSYFMASNSLYLTTMCLQYKPTVVACFCIHLVCKWSNRQIPKSKENLSWYSYIDPNVTQELLEQLTNEFLVVFDKCPSRLKKKIQNSQESLTNQNSISYPFEEERKDANGHAASKSVPSTSSHQKPPDNQNAPGPSRVTFPDKKSASSYSSSSSSSSHHHSFHSPAAKPSVASTNPSLNGSSIQSSSQVIRTNSSHGNVPNQVPQMSSSHHAHKAMSSASMHGNVKPKINPPHGHGSVPQKDQRPDQRKVEIKQEPGFAIKEPTFPIKQEPQATGYQSKQEPAFHAASAATAAAVASISNNSHHSKNNYKKDNGLHQESNRFVASSHSEIISNVVKEVAKQNEKRIKTEPIEEDVKPFVADMPNNVVNSMKTSKNHSIFSPSPVGHDSFKSSPVEERQIPDVQIKQEPPETPAKKSRQYRPGIPESELIPVVKKVETVAGYEDIFRKNTVVVPSASISPKKTTQPVNSVPIKEEPCEVKVENEYSKPTTTTAISQLVNHGDEHKPDATGECPSHPHKKKKKHKEKDKRHDKEKRHKEKKRHKEEKHHHRKEHDREKELKEPGPIKITIPKEKLVDIPMKLKIKINKDQIITPSTSEEPNANDIKLKISKDKLKSRKRERESDHEHQSKKFAYGGANPSHNGYKEYKTG